MTEHQQQQQQMEYEHNNHDDMGDQIDNENEMLIPSGGADGSTKKRSKNIDTPSNHSISLDNNDSEKPTSSSSGGGKTRNRNSKRSGSSRSSTMTMATVIKYVALILLVGQMVGLVLLMRYSRTVPRPPEVPLYLASTAVFVMELMKLVICMIVIMIQSGNNFFHEIKVHIFESPIEIAKLCIPSLLYTVQNNLLYLALSNLDAATYQVCYQLKILTTAVFSAILLNRKFSSLKWLSLIILTIGVAIVEISGSGDQHTNTAAMDQQHHHQLSEIAGGGDEKGAAEAALAAAAIVAAAAAADVLEKKNHYIGIVAVICAACTSGFSGVYFEKILKGSNTSLWIRNVQMGLPSIIIAYITVYFKDAAEVKKQGFLGGYTWIVWTVVIVQAVGGECSLKNDLFVFLISLYFVDNETTNQFISYFYIIVLYIGLIVATVVKYADNVLKVFATSFSIVISCIISCVMFHFRPNTTFIIGASFVVVATVLYSSPEKKERRKTLLPLTNKTRK